MKVFFLLSDLILLVLTMTAGLLLSVVAASMKGVLIVVEASSSCSFSWRFIKIRSKRRRRLMMMMMGELYMKPSISWLLLWGVCTDECDGESSLAFQ